MKKRWRTITSAALSVILSAALLCPLLSVTVGAREAVERMPFPDVFQGKNMYITAKPYEIKNNSEGWILGTELPYRGYRNPEAVCSDGRVLIFKEKQLKDEQGYNIGTTALINFTDTDGNIIIDHSNYNYDEIIPAFGVEKFEFSDGLCSFYDAKTGKCGYMDRQGRIVIPPRYDHVEVFQDGIARAKVYDSENGVTTEYYLDTAGKPLPVPEKVSPNNVNFWFGDGMMPTDRSLRNSAGKSEQFMGYIDTQGNPVITIYRDTAYEYSKDKYLGFCNESSFQDGYAVLEDMRGGRKYPAYVVIDTKGNEVCTLDAEPPYYVQVGGFHGRAGKYIRVDYLETTGGRWGTNVRTAVVDMSTGREVASFPVAENSNDRYTKLEHLGSSTMLTIEKNYLNIDHGLNVNIGYEVRALDGSMLIPNLSEKFTLDPSHRGSYINSYSYIQEDIRNGLGLLSVSGVNPDFSSESYDNDKTYEKLYILEAHEGTYTGSGLVYNAVTGQMSGSGTPQPSGNTPSGWAAKEVNAAITAGIVPDTLQSGYQQPITRAEFCALSVKLYETVKGTEITQRATFTDTDDVNVQKMGALGVVTGVGDGKFAPNGTLTREQAATMLARLAAVMGSPMTAQAPTFADNASISAWAFDAVGQVLGGGVMNGSDNNMFRPKGNYTREQSILTMMRMYNLFH